jgi:hypothetical protein
LEESCIQEVGICDILILIVGGRYGSLAQQEKDAGPRGKSTEGGVGKIKSVTRKEYEKARERAIPIFTFVETGVLSEFKTYQRNKGKTSIEYAHVDDHRVFELIKDIISERK